MQLARRRRINEGASFSGDKELIMNDLQRYLVEEFVEDYQRGRLSRRQALKLITGLTGSALASQILQARAQSAPPPVKAAPAGAPAYHVGADDPAVKAAKMQFAGGEAQLYGYIARPAKEARAPIVLVCHENRGLTPHIEDVTRRLAKAGYVGLAVDLLSREGGTDKLSPDTIPGLFGKADPERHVKD